MTDAPDRVKRPRSGNSGWVQMGRGGRGQPPTPGTPPSQPGARGGAGGGEAWCEYWSQSRWLFSPRRPRRALSPEGWAPGQGKALQQSLLPQKGETWAMPNCSEATCVGNGVITVRARQCPKVQKPICANGYPAVIVANPEDCCPLYECKCELAGPGVAAMAEKAGWNRWDPGRTSQGQGSGGGAQPPPQVPGGTLPKPRAAGPRRREGASGVWSHLLASLGTYWTEFYVPLACGSRQQGSRLLRLARDTPAPVGAPGRWEEARSAAR